MPTKKPSYLGLLNAVALAEARAAEILRAWAAVTSDVALQRALATVAAREHEHGAAFAKRIDELGYSVLDRPDPDHAKRLRFAKSSKPDLEKLESFDFHRDPSLPDIFDRFFEDHSIDIATGELLGRYIAEERDTARLMYRMWRRLERAASSA